MSEAPDQRATRSWAWLSRMPAWAWDAVPVVLLAAGIGLTGSLARPFAALSMTLGLAGVAALLARRRAPRIVFLIAGAGAFIAMVTGDRITPAAIFTVIVALYTVDTRCSRAWSLAASGLAFGGAVLAEQVASEGVRPLGMAIAPAAVIIALWVFGDNLRVRRAYVAGLEERAVWVDAQRAAEARRAADSERARIARELHDVVAHHVAVVAVQAGAARMLSETVDERTRDLLGSIESSAHQAMSELRRLLGVLRREDGGPRSVAPQPGLGQLGQLIDQVRQTGLPVRLTMTGDPCDLPDSVELSAYRIVQEALTNVLKHAGPVATSVALAYDPGQITLTVANRPPAAGQPPAADRSPAGRGEPSGHGLIGMRERVAMAGGELRAGPAADGGFEVFARLPLEPRRPAQLAARRSA